MKSRFKKHTSYLTQKLSPLIMNDCALDYIHGLSKRFTFEESHRGYRKLGWSMLSAINDEDILSQNLTNKLGDPWTQLPNASFI